MNGLNILFNAIFVFGYNMGIAGVGYGTLISRVVAGIVVVFILRNENTIFISTSIFDLAGTVRL